MLLLPSKLLVRTQGTEYLLSPTTGQQKLGTGAWGLYLVGEWYMGDLCHWPAFWILCNFRFIRRGLSLLSHSGDAF